MKKFLLFIILFACFTLSIAQVTDTTKKAEAELPKNWKKGGVGGLCFSQSSFTNWAAGGENAISVAGQLNLFANYKKNKTSWDNVIDLAYGLLKTGTSNFRKNEDKIDFSSKFGHMTGYNQRFQLDGDQLRYDHWYYTALLNFKSQFDNGYNFPDDSTVISHFLAPAYIIGALGLDYKTKENKFSFFISPLTSKTTIVYNQKLANAGAYGVEPQVTDTIAGQYRILKDGEMVRSEFGGYVKIAFKGDIMKNVNLASKLELFTNYLNDPKNIDVNWEVLLAMKVNKFISASISTQMIYDHDTPVPVARWSNGIRTMGTGPRLQFKEVLAVGLSYQF